MARPGESSSVPRPWLVPAALAVVLVILLACSAIVGKHRGSDDSAAVVVAVQETRNFFTLNPASADRDVDQVLALATGQFKKEYAARRKEIVQDVRARNVMVAARVPANGAAIEYLSGSSARVLVAVDVQSRSGGDPVGKRFRSRLTLRKVDGAWLVSKVEQV